MGTPAEHGHSHRSHGHSHHHSHGHAHGHSHGLAHDHAHDAAATTPMQVLRRQLSRRLFVQEFGRRTMAVAILGTATVACASDANETATAAATAVPAEPTATTAPAPDPTAPPVSDESDTSNESDESAAIDSGATGLQWEQVSFGFVSAYVLARGNEYAVVDTGLAGNGAKIGEALGLLGANLDDLDHVILTHLHGDHVGSLPELLEAAPSATAYAGEADVAGIPSPRPLTAVNDGDDVFGLRVIGTPGHTEGHICLFDEAASLLIAGDALVENGGVIEPPPEQFTADMAVALASAKTLAALQFENLAMGHGSPIRGGASGLVADALG